VDLPTALESATQVKFSDIGSIYEYQN